MNVYKRRFHVMRSSLDDSASGGSCGMNNNRKVVEQPKKRPNAISKDRRFGLFLRTYACVPPVSVCLAVSGQNSGGGKHTD
eukprot:2735456-Pyramimonas_sp.AAC.1